MKLFAVVGALVAGVAALRTTEEFHETEMFENHELFWCCDRKGGEKCGLVWRSCCQPGRCTTSAVGVKYCPDAYQLNC